MLLKLEVTVRYLILSLTISFLSACTPSTITITSQPTTTIIPPVIGTVPSTDSEFSTSTPIPSVEITPNVILSTPIGNSEHIAFNSLHGQSSIDFSIVESNGNNIHTFFTGALGSVLKWSPDGQKLAILTRHTLYVFNSDGSNRRYLADDIALYYFSWSSDSNKIAFEIDNEIFAVSVDKGDLYQITSNNWQSHYPVWSPVEDQIAFVSRKNESDDSEIYVVQADGSNLHQITDNDIDDFGPVWSPDGRKMAFISDQDGNWEIYVIDMFDYGNLYNITNHEAGEDQPRWSPDGKHIIFVSGRDGNAEIYRVNTDGSNLENLTKHHADDKHPDYSPDGTRIVFSSNRGKGSSSNKWFEIYIMNVDNYKTIRLTDTGFNSLVASWQPLD